VRCAKQLRFPPVTAKSQFLLCESQSAVIAANLAGLASYRQRRLYEESAAYNRGTDKGDSADSVGHLAWDLNSSGLCSCGFNDRLGAFAEAIVNIAVTHRNP
jgi:hypothetical protein